METAHRWQRTSASSDEVEVAGHIQELERNSCGVRGDVVQEVTRYRTGPHRVGERDGVEQRGDVVVHFESDRDVRAAVEVGNAQIITRAWNEERRRAVGSQRHAAAGRAARNQ